MNRRSVLRAGGTLALGIIAGCLSEGEPEFNLRIVDRDFGPGTDGNLTVWITVSNPGNEPEEGIVYLTTDINTETSAKVSSVKLGAHETGEVEFEYDVAYENVTSFDMDASVEPDESISTVGSNE